MSSLKRYWPRLVVIGLGLGLCSVVIGAGAQAITTLNPGWIHDRQRQVEEVIGVLAQDPITVGAITPALQQQAEQTVADHRRRVEARRNQGQAPRDDPASPKVIVYVSMSLGTATLEDLFAAAAGRDDVTIVFRGITSGQRLPAFAMRLNEMASRVGAIRPNVTIDPTLFTLADVQAVPVIAVLAGEGSHTRVEAIARGILNIDWFQAKLDRGDSGDFGQVGALSAIAEPDLIEELKRRAAGLDFDAMKRRALAGYWRNAHFETLTPAAVNRERWIDPTVQIARDIRTPSGTLIAMAGSRVNPLEHITFNRLLIVFDGESNAQVAAAHEAAKDAGSRKPVFLVTRLDRDQAWDRLADLEKQLSGPVYLLTPELRQRFAIEHTLSVVESVGTRFRVTEIAVRATTNGGKDQ